MELARGLSLIAATITTGLVAGLFFAFAHAVMPGLGRSEDRTFVAAFQAIDAAIDNPWQGLSFVGAPVFTALSAVLHLGAGDDSSVGWVSVAALLLYGGMVAITFRVHLPLNREIQRAGDPGRVGDLAAVRSRFEARWVRWNVVRAVLSAAAFGCLTWALVLSGGG